MNIGEYIINAIERRRDRKRKSHPGPAGDFYRNGGNSLLYDMPVSTGNLVIDAGGYKGEWTAKMIVRYGCRSEVYEPIPLFAEYCKQLFARNTMVRVHAAGLGGSSRTATFNLAASGTSEFKGAVKTGNIVEAEVLDVSQVFNQLGSEPVACMKLNIEGGEYEVLERLLNTNQIVHCDSLLVQFHQQPADYKSRYRDIENHLRVTHSREWCYPMVWEKWIRKASG